MAARVAGAVKMTVKTKAKMKNKMQFCTITVQKSEMQIKVNLTRMEMFYSGMIFRYFKIQ